MHRALVMRSGGKIKNCSLSTYTTKYAMIFFFFFFLFLLFLSFSLSLCQTGEWILETEITLVDCSVPMVCLPSIYVLCICRAQHSIVVFNRWRRRMAGHRAAWSAPYLCLSICILPITREWEAIIFLLTILHDGLGWYLASSLCGGKGPRRDGHGGIVSLVVKLGNWCVADPGLIKKLLRRCRSLSFCCQHECCDIISAWFLFFIQDCISHSNQSYHGLLRALDTCPPIFEIPWHATDRCHQSVMVEAAGQLNRPSCCLCSQHHDHGIDLSMECRSWIH